MAITSAAQVARALPGQRIPILKTSQSSEGAGTWHSYWKLAGWPLTAGANPPAYTAGSGYVPTSATAGALTFIDPAGGQNSYLAQAVVQASTTGVLILYDRLWACSGFSGTSTGLQSVTTPGSLTAARDPYGGEDVEPWFEWYTAIGATTANWTVVYNDSGGASSTAPTFVHPANAESVGQMMPIQLAAGDLGVDSMTSFQSNASSGTAGDFGFTLVRRIAELPIPVANRRFVFDWQELGLPRIYDGSCLALMFHQTGTTSPVLNGFFSIIQG